MWRKMHLVFCWGHLLLCEQQKGKLGFQGAMGLFSYPDLEEPRTLISWNLDRAGEPHLFGA